jgi:hypothetical protein
MHSLSGKERNGTVSAELRQQFLLVERVRLSISPMSAKPKGLRQQNVAFYREAREEHCDTKKLAFKAASKDSLTSLPALSSAGLCFLGRSHTQAGGRRPNRHREYA